MLSNTEHQYPSLRFHKKNFVYMYKNTCSITFVNILNIGFIKGFVSVHDLYKKTYNAHLKSRKLDTLPGTSMASEPELQKQTISKIYIVFFKVFFFLLQGSDLIPYCPSFFPHCLWLSFSN
jgi:hypothetical protein